MTKAWSLISPAGLYNWMVRTSYRSRIASIKNAASSEKMAMSDEIAYSGTLRSQHRTGGSALSMT